MRDAFGAATAIVLALCALPAAARAATPTPSTNLAVRLTTAPTHDGNEGLVYRVEVTNTGTSPVFGAVLTFTGEPGVDLGDTDVDNVETHAGDGDYNPFVTRDGGSDWVWPWAAGDTVTFGDPSPEGWQYYLDRGLEPGAMIRFDLVGAQLPAGLADGSVITLGVTLSSDDPETVEDDLGDNVASAVAVHREADVFATKTMTLAGGATGPAQLGDVIEVEIGYGNAGAASAAVVDLYDDLPAGVAYVMGSLSGLPSTYDWGFERDTEEPPDVADGEPDPSVRAIAIAGPLGARDDGAWAMSGEALRDGERDHTDVYGGRVRATPAGGTWRRIRSYKQRGARHPIGPTRLIGWLR
ncbi:MAG: hypothetical protein KC635_27500, partial [Myxococcales bacterium]|nr:hypothetical protein [Myxococcales bacterium]